MITLLFLLFLFTIWVYFTLSRKIETSAKDSIEGVMRVDPEYIQYFSGFLHFDPTEHPSDKFRPMRIIAVDSAHDKVPKIYIRGIDYTPTNKEIIIGGMRYSVYVQDNLENYPSVVFTTFVINGKAIHIGFEDGWAKEGVQYE